MTQYKYYFKKPKGEIVKDVLGYIAAAGIIYVAAGSPYFVLNVMKSLLNKNKYKKKEMRNAFYRLMREGSIIVEKKDHQIYIKLSDKGRKKAGRYQINHLQVKKPKKWDKKWRVIVFDIEQSHRIKREALRGLLKRLNFYPFQKSVWLHPFDCRDEIELIKDFFGFNSNEIRLIVSDDIGYDSILKRYYNLK